jgi:hypothetical protein
MPIVIIVIGIVLIFAAINNKLEQLSQLLQDEWSPSESGVVGFPVWLGAISVVAVIGYVKELKPISNAFMVLIFVVLFLVGGQGGSFFKNLFAAFQNKNLANSQASNAQTGAVNSSIPTLGAGSSLQQVISSFSPSLEGIPDPSSLPSSGLGNLSLPNFLNLGGN